MKAGKILIGRKIWPVSPSGGSCNESVILNARSEKPIEEFVCYFYSGQIDKSCSLIYNSYYT